jgi:hypothetical protein
LGAFYGALGLASYIPQELGLGALAIVAINWLYYRHKARASNMLCDSRPLRRAMVSSAGAGLLAMGAGFILLEWLNHGVVNAAHHHPAAGSLLPWTSNQNLLYMVGAIVLDGWW